MSCPFLLSLESVCFLTKTQVTNRPQVLDKGTVGSEGVWWGVGRFVDVQKTSAGMNTGPQRYLKVPVGSVRCVTCPHDVRSGAGQVTCDPVGTEVEPPVASEPEEGRSVTFTSTKGEDYDMGRYYSTHPVDFGRSNVVFPHLTKVRARNIPPRA